MGAPLAVAAAIKGLGIVAAAAAAAGRSLSPAARRRAVSALVALALTPVLVVSELWNSDQVRHLRDHPSRAGQAAAHRGRRGSGGRSCALFRRRPEALPLLVVLSLPVRIPLATGQTSANLLIPLYVVVAGGVTAYAMERLWRPGPTPAWRERKPGAVEIALLAFVVLYALQSLYSSDFEQAVKNVAFFYVPFALLLKLTTVRWSRRLVVQCFGSRSASRSCSWGSGSGSTPRGSCSGIAR